MAARRKPTAATWRRLAEAARDSREAQHLTRPALAKMANVSEGSVERLELAKMPETDKFPRAYAWILHALRWPDEWAEAILDGSQTGAPVISDSPIGPFTNTTGDPKVEKLLLHYLRGDSARVIALEATMADLVKIRLLVDEAIAERALIEVEVPAQPGIRPERRRARSTRP